MANDLYIPYLNPVRFYETLTDNPAYLSKPWTDYAYASTIHAWEQRQLYSQKWQNSDTIRLQFESNYDPIQIDVMDGDGNSYLTVVANQKLANKYEPGTYAYEAELSLASIPAGCYQLVLNAGANLVIMYSEPFNLAAVQPETKLIEYTNSRYHGDVIFETGIVFSFRVEATLGKLITGSQDVVYDDQKLNPTLLSSIATRSYPFVIGGEFGTPEWVDDLQSQIWTCNSVTIDGRSYAKSSDSAASVQTEDEYPLYAITRNVREGINRGSKVVSTTANPNKKLVVIYNINTGVFGDVGENGATNIISILSSE